MGQWIYCTAMKQFLLGCWDKICLIGFCCFQQSISYQCLNVINVNINLKQTKKLTSHHNSLYENIKYKCNLCGNQFISKRSITKHKQSIQGRKFSCSLCEHLASSRGHLTSNWKQFLKFKDVYNLKTKEKLKKLFRFNLNVIQWNTNGNGTFKWVNSQAYNAAPDWPIDYKLPQSKQSLVKLISSEAFLCSVSKKKFTQKI